MTKPETEPDNRTEENVLAYTAITLCGNPTQGQPPQWHELAAWREGTLSEQRALEVLSHVANDPSCFQQWLDIVDAESWVAEEMYLSSESATEPDQSQQPTISLFTQTIETLRAFFQQPLPVYGGAFAAVILAVLLSPLLRTGDGLSLQQQLDRSTDAYIDTGHGFSGSPPSQRNTRSLGGLFDDLSVNDVDRLHFQAGVHLFYSNITASEDLPVSDAWQDWLNGLSGEKADCSKALDSAHCEAVADDLLLLGQWSLMSTGACNARTTQDSGSMDAQFWSDQYSTYTELRQLPGITQSQIFAPLLPPLQSPTPDSLCTIAVTVLAAGR